MDPDANLRELRELAAGIRERIDADDPIDSGEAIEWAGRMAELTEALDGWLTRGGFLPQAWRNR